MEVKSAQDATTLEMEMWVDLNLSEAEDLRLDVFFLLQRFSFPFFPFSCVVVIDVNVNRDRLGQ